MTAVATLLEYYRHNDWGRDKLTTLAAGLTDEQLDRPLRIGPGSLRATLYHLWAAEYGWLNRWQPQEERGYSAECHGEAVTELNRRFVEAATERRRLMSKLSDTDLTRPITYVRATGKPFTFKLGDMHLHVCNHGVHHRAQAVNMLRQLGATLPKLGLDYIFMKVEQESAESPALDPGILRRHYEYSDWARDHVHAIAATLTDEQLDRPFALGAGSIRAALAHILFGERWWYQNWTLGPGQPFPETDRRITISEVVDLFHEVTTQRNALLAACTPQDLLRPVSAMPRPNVTRTFALGVTMLQLCCHGTHHRAQVLNMFRQVGTEVPALDFMAMLREHAANSRGSA